MPKFSIITISLNRKEEGLEKTIQSVATQEFKDYEYIVVDAGSTDGSIDVIKKNKKYISKWVSEKDNGRYDGMNKGIRMASGEYILFLNAGDYLASPFVLAELANYALTERLYFGNLIVQEKDKQPFIVDFGKEVINLDFFLKYALPHQATLFHRSLFSEYGVYDPEYRIHGDHEYYVRLLKNGVTFNHLPVGISVYDPAGISANPRFAAVSKSEKSRLFDKTLGYPAIHFLTIVLNGLPFIEYHIEVLKELPFKWHWHIVEGAAELKNDTAWSVANGGNVGHTFNKRGRSKDGTSEYIDKLQKAFPENITIYRKPLDEYWDGKLEMVNAPLSNITEDCLLWQLDSDEIWTKEQIIRVRELFLSAPEKTAAKFLCHFFVGKDLVLSNLNKFGNTLTQEWLRVWRFSPGFRWTAHEPPTLCKMNSDGTGEDIAKGPTFTQLETASLGLIFQHYGYVTPAQLEFKEQYYGLKNVLSNWQKLQKVTSFPVYVRDYFSWVKDTTTVNRAEELGIDPIISFEKDGGATFDYENRPLATISDNMLYNLIPLQNTVQVQPAAMSWAKYSLPEIKILEMIHKVRMWLFPPGGKLTRITKRVLSILRRRK